jgi:hypothetical protein
MRRAGRAGDASGIPTSPCPFHPRGWNGCLQRYSAAFRNSHIAGRVLR